jgi:hypothetical protein
MRKLTDRDLTNIAGATIQGYHVEGVRIKRGKFSDSDHYGIILGRNNKGSYVTWQFHLDEDETVNAYWGHYVGENKEAALRDFDTRDLDTKPFKVTITETLKLTVEVEAIDRHEAEQTVSDNWRNSGYVLTADNFADVEFKAVDAEAEKDALGIIWDKYLQYLRDWATSHAGSGFYGMTPACFDEWLNCEYPEVDDNAD